VGAFLPALFLFQEEFDMSIRIFTIQGYAHLYRSLLRFCKVSNAEALELVYMLNTANLDSYAYTHPGRKYAQSSPVRFFAGLGADFLPYRTEVQLYKAMAALDHHMDHEALIASQREEVQHMRCLMRELDIAFYKTFGMDIDDKRTVYGQCVYGLVPREDEPSVCLMKDWVNLPTA